MRLFLCPYATLFCWSWECSACRKLTQIYRGFELCFHSDWKQNSLKLAFKALSSYLNWTANWQLPNWHYRSPPPSPPCPVAPKWMGIHVEMELACSRGYYMQVNNKLPFGDLPEKARQYASTFLIMCFCVFSQGAWKGGVRLVVKICEIKFWDSFY